MLKYFRKFLFSIVFIGYSSAFAGSFEYFFQAIYHDNPDTVQYWLSRGFDPNSPDESMLSPLILAISKESYKSAKVLINDGRTRLEAENNHNENALMLLAIRNQTELVQLMIDKGAEVNHKGWSALHYAASRGHVEMVRLLLENSAYIDASSPTGETPLMMAVLYGTPQTVKLLLEEGADPTVTNNNGNTALDFALSKQQEQNALYIQAFIDAWHHQEEVDALRAEQQKSEQKADEKLEEDSESGSTEDK
jgi:uncharacterized protein